MTPKDMTYFVGFLQSQYALKPGATITAFTQTYSTADATHAAATQTAVVTTGAALAAYGYTEAQANDIVTQLNAARLDILDVKQLANSIIDALQANGLFG